MDFVLARALDESIDEREVEVAFGGFHLFPVDRRLDGVGVEVLNGLEDLRQFTGPGAGVVDLAAEHQEGLAVDEEGVAAVFLDELWRFFSVEKLSAGESCEENECGQAESFEHDWVPWPM